MPHVRQQIRDAIGAALTGLPSTGSRVFVSRLYPLQEIELPALRISWSDESSTPMTMNESMISSRTARINVVAVAKQTAALDDELDTICAEVEAALANPVAALSPLARTIILTGTTTDLSGESDQPTGSATLTYEVEYFTAENAPDVAL